MPFLYFVYFIYFLYFLIFSYIFLYFFINFFFFCILPFPIPTPVSRFISLIAYKINFYIYISIEIFFIFIFYFFINISYNFLFYFYFIFWETSFLPLTSSFSSSTIYSLSLANFYSISSPYNPTPFPPIYLHFYSVSFVNATWFFDIFCFCGELLTIFY